MNNELTIKAVCSNCDTFLLKSEKDFHVSEYYGKYLMSNPLTLSARKLQVEADNNGVRPYTGRHVCQTCGSNKQHPETGYCFVCNTDNF